MTLKPGSGRLLGHVATILQLPAPTRGSKHVSQGEEYKEYCISFPLD